MKFSGNQVLNMMQRKGYFLDPQNVDRLKNTGSVNSFSQNKPNFSSHQLEKDQIIEQLNMDCQEKDSIVMDLLSLIDVLSKSSSDQAVCKYAQQKLADFRMKVSQCKQLQSVRAKIFSKTADTPTNITQIQSLINENIYLKSQILDLQQKNEQLEQQLQQQSIFQSESQMSVKRYPFTASYGPSSRILHSQNNQMIQSSKFVDQSMVRSPQPLTDSQVFQNQITQQIRNQGVHLDALQFVDNSLLVDVRDTMTQFYNNQIKLKQQVDGFQQKYEWMVENLQQIPRIRQRVGILLNILTNIMEKEAHVLKPQLFEKERELLLSQLEFADSQRQDLVNHQSTMDQYKIQQQKLKSLDSGYQHKVEFLSQRVNALQSQLFLLQKRNITRIGENLSQSGIQIKPLSTGENKFLTQNSQKREQNPVEQPVQQPVEPTLIVSAEQVLYDFISQNQKIEDELQVQPEILVQLYQAFNSVLMQKSAAAFPLLSKLQLKVSNVINSTTCFGFLRTECQLFESVTVEKFQQLKAEMTQFLAAAHNYLIVQSLLPSFMTSVFSKCKTQFSEAFKFIEESVKYEGAIAQIDIGWTCETAAEKFVGLLILLKFAGYQTPEPLVKYCEVQPLDVKNAEFVTYFEKLSKKKNFVPLLPYAHRSEDVEPIKVKTSQK